MVAHLALIPISGTSINPARSLGTAVLSGNNQAWTDLWVFIVGPYLASFLGVALYVVFFRSDGVVETLFKSNNNNVNAFGLNQIWKMSFRTFSRSKGRAAASTAVPVVEES